MSISQFLAIAATFLITYIFFQALGPRQGGLFFSKDQKAVWDTNLKRGLGDWLVVASIFGTLTSFATYLFLIGSVKLFGWFALSTAITIALSAPVTNWLTKPLLVDSRISNLLNRNDQVASVIATLFWSDTANGRAISHIVKWVSCFVILTVIWLECTAFVDLTFWVSGYARGDDSAILHWRFIGLLVVAFSIVFFVLRYGIRGFVFADLLHSPLIGLGAITVLVGTIWLTRGSISSLSLAELGAPLLTEPVEVLGIGLAPGLIFAVHVLVLNLFQITCTEHHWFRMWLFGEKELRRQLPGTLLTGGVWLLMLPVGFLAFTLSGQPGEAAIAALVTGLGEISQIFGLLFWIGATAALFSTADIQVYSALLVSRFDPQTGELRRLELSSLKAFVWALVVAMTFAAAYTGVRAVALPLEKIIFVVVPMCTVLLPAFLHFALGRQPRAWVIGVSFVGYLGVAAYGFLVAESDFAPTLSAIFVPLVVGLLTIKLVPRR